MFRSRGPQSISRALLGGCVSLTQIRHQSGWGVSAGGKNYHPPGQRSAANAMTIDDEGIEKLKGLAKVAYKERNYMDALKLYERLTDYYRQKHETAVHDDIAAVLYDAARIHMDLKNPQEATYPAEEAAAILEKLHGERDPKTVEAMALVAMIYRTTRTPDVATKAFVEVLETMNGLYYNHKEKRWTPSTPNTMVDPSKSPLATVAHVLADYSALSTQVGDIRAAMELLEQALEIRRYLYMDHLTFKPMVAQTLVKLAELSRHKGTIAEAEIQIEEAIKICMQCGGREAPATAQAISTRGNIHLSKNEINLAKKCFLESVTTFTLAYGNESPLVAHELVLLGRCCQVLKEGAEAEKTYHRAHMIYLSMYGLEHVQVADVLSHSGALKFELGRFTDAEKDFTTALQIRKKLNLIDTQMCMLCHKLGELYAAMKKTEAETYFLEAIATYKIVHANNLLLATDVMDDLGWFYSGFSLHEKALQYFEESLKIRQKELQGNNHPSIGYSQSNLAAVYTARREYDKAEAAALNALKIYRNVPKPHWLPEADCCQNLGQIYRNQQKWKEAITMYEKAMYVRRMNGQHLQEAFAELLFNTAKCMVDGGVQLDSAEKHLDEAIEIINSTSRNDENLQRLYKLRAEVKHKQSKLLEGVSS